MERTRLRVAVVLLLVVLPAGSARAQAPSKRAVGEDVFVTHAGSGEVLRGRLLELSPTSLAMLVNGQRVDVPLDDVLRIDARGDSVKDGAIIGAAVMAGLSGLGCAAVDEARYCVTSLVVNTGIGALVGAGIDALHKGRTPIYIKPERSGAALQVRFRF